MTSLRRSLAAAAALATLSLAYPGSASAQLPDKQSDRGGWIKASMSGAQAKFCAPVAAAKLGGGSDPDFVAKQVLGQWEGQQLIDVKIGEALFLANALCKFPGNPDLQAALTPVWNSWTRLYGFAAADWNDFSDALTPGLGTGTSPRAPKDTPLASVQGLEQAKVAKELLVTSYGMDFMSYAQLLDGTKDASEHMKVAFVEACVDGYHKSIARWAICKTDALSLDRKRFDSELRVNTVSPRSRIEAKMRFVRLQKAVAAQALAMKKEADKDDGVKKVVDTIVTAAAKQWASESAEHKSVLAWSYKLLDDARANNKKLMSGCEDSLRTHLGTYLKAKAPRNEDEMKNAFRDNIGSQLANAATSCFVRNPAAQTYWANRSSGFSEYWGPRTMVWHALVAEKIDFDTDRGNDPLGLPKPVILYANSSSAGSSGTIAAMKKGADSVEIRFKKETWTEKVCKQWKETDRVDGIDLKTGKLVYRSRCVKTGTEKRTSQATNVTVASEYTAGLKVGTPASFARNSDGSGYPTAIYKSKKRETIVGAFGVLY